MSESYLNEFVTLAFKNKHWPYKSRDKYK